MDRSLPPYPPTAIAIVGMGARLPGANNLDEFWANLRGGVESITRLSDAELRESGVAEEALRDPDYVKAATVLNGIEMFDAPFFGFSPRDAAIMDPQHRLFLECAWEALEHAGWSADAFPGSIGVFAGSGMNAYLMFNLVPNQQLMASAGLFLLKQTGNDKDVLATRVSYQLSLTGPSVTVQTACSTSLVAVHMACQSLLSGECDMALAGGVTIEIPHKQGYMYREGEILSRDGHCRSFDAQASGTVFGSGAGVVVLRRLADAMAGGDHIHAVIRGSAINNDGARKVGYFAPSVDGQAEVIAEAMEVAEAPAESISYVEAHGTGTPVGDPIEVAAITQAFRATTQARGFCGIGSLKTNIGHLDAAAGVAGLIKTVLALKNRELPPSLHFQQPNPHIDFANSPFYVNHRLGEWKRGATPRRAGVTSLGIGGTNAHVILEEAPQAEQAGESRPWQVLTLSAKTASALEHAATNLADHLETHPELNLADTAFTCHLGRKAFAQRQAVLCRTREDAVEALRNASSKRVFSGKAAGRANVAFLFPGQGAQYVHMARGVYESEAVFRAEVDHCAQLFESHLGLDLRTLLFPPDGADLAQATAQLTETRFAQPALFTIEYALAKLWMAWGVQPAAMVGHSIGELVAACLAGVLSMEDACKTVAARGRLMQSAAPGAMLAVQMAETEARALAVDEISIAAVNGTKQCVLSGPTAAIAALGTKLAAAGMMAQRLQTSHAFHSASMDAILEEFTTVMRGLKLQAPQIRYVSNVTGTWIKPEEATDPTYWARHLRSTVRFSDGLATLFHEQPIALLEVGPGRVLAGLAARHPAKTEGVRIVSPVRSAQEPGEDAQHLMSALAQLWVSGAKFDWAGFHAAERRQRVPLPTYPFERQRHWIDAPKPQLIAAPDSASVSYYKPVWKPAELPAKNDEHATWLIFLDSLGVGNRIAKELDRVGNTVITLSPGERFSKTGKQSYTLDASGRADYDRLLTELASSGSMPRRILHLWNLIPPASIQESGGLAEAQTLSFYSLLYLAQSIGRQDISDPMSLSIVSNDLQSVSGELIRHPERALSLGPCKIIPKEFANISTRAIDVVLPEDGGLDALALQIILEAGQPVRKATEVVAYRGSERRVETLEPEQLETAVTRIRRKGVYLITGGTRGIGLAIAEHLAGTAQAKLVLVSRTGKLERPDAMRTLHELGAEVEVAQADVTDLNTMRDTVSRARARFGHIDGVIHAAGILDDGLIQLKQKDAADRVLAPKVTGTLVLEKALKGEQLDFFVLFSSVSCYTAPVGQVDYVAANSFLNSYAAASRVAGRPWTVAINWGRWGEVGMAALRGGRGGSGHPWLGACTIDTPDNLVYRSELSYDDHWALREHSLSGGDGLFPGTGYLELARAAMRDHFGEGAMEFERVSFSAPLLVTRGQPRGIEMRMARQDGNYHFTVLAAGSAVPYATGAVRILSTAAQTIDLPGLVKRCNKKELNLEPERQNAKQAKYIEFGPRWRSLRRIHFGDHEAASFVEFPEGFSGELQIFRLHPALLDAATGSAVFTVPGYEESGDLFVPLSYERLCVYRDLPRRCWAHIRWTDSNHAEKEAVTFDITIAGEDGEVVAEIQGFTMRRLSTGASLAGDPAGVLAAAGAMISTNAGCAAFSTILDGFAAFQVLAVPRTLHLEQPDLRAAEPAARPVSPRSNGFVPAIARPSNGVPRDEVELTLAKWWKELLGLEQVSIHEDFFELGGHSLIAVRLLARIEKEMGKTVPLHVFFEDRTIESLAEAIRGGKIEPTMAGIRFSTAQPNELEAVGTFLVSVFSDPWLAAPDMLQWHYFKEREDWQGPRSYVLKQGNTILAHGGVDPVTLCTPHGHIPSINGSDWAAAESAPGAGVILLREVAKLADVYLVPGGSTKTRSILPEIGFRPSVDRYTYGLVVRPWKHVQLERGFQWKTPLRLGRNVVRNLLPRASANGWSSVPLQSFSEAEAPLLDRRPDSCATRCRRTPGLLNYMLACPSAAMSAFLLLQNDVPQGYCIVSRLGHQARIADLSLTSDSPADWEAAYALATQTAASDPGVAEILTVACTDLARRALDRNHFSVREGRPMLVRDPKGLLDGAPPLDIQWIDGDGFFLPSR